MLENTVYSILSPEGFATILWKDGSRSEEAAELMKITSGELLNMGIVDKVIPERAYFTSEIIEAIKTAIIDELAELSQLSTEDLLEARYQRLENIKKQLGYYSNVFRRYDVRRLGLRCLVLRISLAHSLAE